MTTILESAALIAREGLEAILVLAALSAYLIKSGAGDRIRWLHAGALVAIVASIALAVVFQLFNNGMHDDRVEGIVLIIAAVLMLYVSGWLFLKQDPRAWQAYLKERTDKAASRNSVLALAALAFLAVFREGAETALFLHALAKTRGGWSVDIGLGIALAAMVLIALWVVLTRTSQRLPLRAVFLVTSGLLFLMALKFIGEAFQEFQEQALIGYHPTPYAAFIEKLGLNATWEALGTQLALVALSGIAALFTLRHHRAQSSN